ncbi:spry domain containing socs box protein [Anaeramoeba flamelloides]|uniref:Spry domain containing socs box protein n=1 Tax=Anaeramoeba flamelloides TaxID=1746091 RepID=A0AAV7ZE70_9EUKA|nr:spry domain containing socs box protein [Anaeramoeba flamelloides]KAJ6227047.1 spry domain containing socs box protein [Anaeramoeba flamelloides]
MITDKFDSSTKSRWVRVLNEGETVRQIRQENGTIKGTYVMKAPGKYKHEFRLDRTNGEGYEIMIGVVKKGVTEVSFWDKDGYVFHLTGQKCHNNKSEVYGDGQEEFTDGSILYMTTDMDNRTVSYSTPNEDFGVCFENIPEEVVMALDIYYEHDQITLVNFEKLN